MANNYTNFARTTIAEDLAISETALDVTNIATFPTSFPFYATIWDAATYPDPTNDTAGREIVQVTANPSGSTFTIVRARGGTSDIAHDSGEAFAHCLTAEDMEALNKLSSDTRKWWAGAADDMSIWYDGTDGQIKTSDVAPSDLIITCGANKTIELANTVWNELPTVPITGAKLGSSAPTLATFVGNVEQYTFDATNDYVIGATEVTHGYKEGTDLLVHIHWASNGVDGTDRFVKWLLEYTIANADRTAPFGSAFGAAVSLSPNLTIPASTPDRSHIFSQLGTITGTTVTLDAYIVWKLSRIAATGTAPSADPFALAIGFHVQNDTIGSRTESAK